MEYKIRKFNNRGYTLIELLVVMVIMMVIGGIIAAILVSTLRGTNKNNTIDDIRLNGNSVITQVSKMIEFSQSFVGVNNSGDSVPYSSNCVLSSPAPSPLPQYKYLRIISFDNAATTFSCSGSPLTIASNSASLLDTNKVSVSADPTSLCYFTCVQSGATDTPTIGINFTLFQKSSSLFFEKIYSIPFQTSVKIRNTR